MGRGTLRAMLGVRTMLRSRLCRPWPCDLGLIGGSLGLICEMGVLTLPPGGGHGRQGHCGNKGLPLPSQLDGEKHAFVSQVTSGPVSGHLYSPLNRGQVGLAVRFHRERRGCPR